MGAAALARVACPRRPRFAAVRLDAVGGGAPVPAGWIGACHRLTPRVEPAGAAGALLDLGACSEAEARSLVAGLLERLAAGGVAARAGVGPGLTLAQLALLAATGPERLVLVAPADAAALLARAPVGLLARLHPPGPATPLVVARLERYGLRTLGQVARLGEPALRRQFGDAAGAFLAATARGDDPCPLRPAPPVTWRRLRLRFDPAASGEAALAALPRAAERMAAELRGRGQAPRALRLALRLESGGAAVRRRALRRPTDDASVLAWEWRRLLLALLPSAGRGRGVAVADLALAAGDFAPVSPRQESFWPTRDQRQGALDALGQALARRSGRPLLLQARATAPEAIFAEERYRFVPAGGPSAAREASDACAPPAARERAPLRLHWW